MKKFIFLFTIMLSAFGIMNAQNWDYEFNTITTGAKADTSYFYVGSDSTLAGSAKLQHYGYLNWTTTSDSVSGATAATTLIQGTNASNPSENDWVNLDTLVSNGATRQINQYVNANFAWLRLRARTIAVITTQNSKIEHHLVLRRKDE